MICAPGLDLCVAEPAFVPQNGAGTDEDIVEFSLASGPYLILLIFC